MRFLADEGVERYLVEALRSQGHGVAYVAESASGVSDQQVFALALAQQAVLITNDKDFGEIVFQQGKVSAGVILLRLAGVPEERKVELLLTMVAEHGSELSGAFSVLTGRVLRIRRSPVD